MSTTTKARAYWTCEGSVRGDCGVQHRTEDAAQEHCEQDERNDERVNGDSSYSDRRPVQHNPYRVRVGLDGYGGVEMVVETIGGAEMVAETIAETIAGYDADDPHVVWYLDDRLTALGYGNTDDWTRTDFGYTCTAEAV